MAPSYLNKKAMLDILGELLNGIAVEQIESNKSTIEVLSCLVD